jgi:predicted lipoprotein
MKRITLGLCMAAALLFAAAPSGAFAAAKAQTSKKMAKADAPKKAATEYTGCVEAGTAKGSYQLTHVDGQSGPLTLSGDAAEVAKHVGHKVTVTGSGAAPKVKVKSVAMVAPTCP